MMPNCSRLCMGCMSENREVGQPCPVCGFCEETAETPPHVLPPRTILNGKYLIGKRIGQGGFGIIYLGWDLNLEIKLAIKEFYPDGFVSRDHTLSPFVTPHPGEDLEFYRGRLEKFVDEARRLARFCSLPGIVSVRDYFQENGTAYIVMEFIEGTTLKEYLKLKGGRLSVGETLSLLRPVMESLETVHTNGIIHRDISPDNIMIDREGCCRLLDFGAAQEYQGDGSHTILLKHGYSPYEQYQSHGRQGPWTDVYAMSATVYRCITGEIPVEAPMRFPEDVLKNPRFLGAKLSPAQEAALLKGLARSPEERWQNMEQLRRGLLENMSFDPGPAPHPDPAGRTNSLHFLGKLLQKASSALFVLFHPDHSLKEYQKKGSFPSLSHKDWLVLGGSGGILLLVLLILPKVGTLTASLHTESSDSYSSAVSASPEGDRAEIAPIDQWEVQEDHQNSAAQLRQPPEPDAAVKFADWAMEYHVRSALGKAEGAITQADLAQVQQLHICNIRSSINAGPPDTPDSVGRTGGMGDGSPVPHLTTLDDLKYFINLKELSLTSQDFTDLTPIAQLTGLTYLNLHGSNLSDLQPLSALTNLEVLDIGGGYLHTPTDISPLRSLNNLRELHLDSVRNLTVLSPLASLTKLEMLDLQSTGRSAMKERSDFMDVSFLSQLTNLKQLDLRSCKVGMLTSLSPLSQLEQLDISGCAVDDLSPLSGLTQLKVLRFSPGYQDTGQKTTRKPESLSPLSSLTQLTELEFSGLDAPDLSPLASLHDLEILSMEFNHLTDLEPLAGLTNLRELNIENNEISDLSALAQMEQLERLEASLNPITNLTPLKSLPNLNYLSMIRFENDPCYVTDWSPVSHVETVKGRPE